MKQVLSWLEIVMSPNALSWGQSKIKTGYMHENVKYTVIKHLTKKQNSIHISQTNNTILLSNNTHTFRELLPNRRKHIFRVHIKHYWHFQGVTPKHYYTFFQTSNSTDISRELLANNIIHFPWAYIKQYWYFQRIT